jgi:hypothetical protein
VCSSLLRRLEERETLKRSMQTLTKLYISQRATSSQFSIETICLSLLLPKRCIFNRWCVTSCRYKRVPVQRGHDKDIVFCSAVIWEVCVCSSTHKIDQCDQPRMFKGHSQSSMDYLMNSLRGFCFR